MVKNSGQKEILHRTKLWKFSKVAVEKTPVFGNLNYPKTCALSCVTLIYVRDHMVKFSTQGEKVCRTNLIQIGKAAEKKDWVFRGLIKSKLDAHFCVILIWYKKALVWISDHLEKVSRSNLIEFSDSRINRSPKIIRHLMFPQPSFAKACMWLVITSYYTPLLWFISKAGKTYGKILVRYFKECLIFQLMLDGNLY